MEKQWKNFGNYKISEFGEVVSLFTGKLLTQAITKDGYFKVDLTLDIGRKKFSVHRMVALLFLDNYTEDLEVNHKDADKSNNHYTNLEMCTHAENIKHAWDNNLIKRSKQGTNNIVQATSIKVQCINTGEVFNSISDASLYYNITKTGISAQIKGRQKTAGKHKQTGEGLRWKILN